MNDVNEQPLKDTNYPVDDIIALAWDDKVSFDGIHEIYGLSEKDVITIMRQNLKPSSFRLWRKRVNGRKSKHGNLSL